MFNIRCAPVTQNLCRGRTIMRIFLIFAFFRGYSIGQFEFVRCQEVTAGSVGTTTMLSDDLVLDSTFAGDRAQA